LLTPAFLLAFGIEVAQIWRDQTTANFTDVLLCTFGAAAGMFVTRRLMQSTLGSIAEEALQTQSACQISAGHPPVDRLAYHPNRRPWPRAVLASVSVIALSGAAAATASWWLPGKSPIARTAQAESSSRQSIRRQFTAMPSDPRQPPSIAPLNLPPFNGAAAIWGATGRDSKGHIWLGVSAQGVAEPSAHLMEYVPETKTIRDRGDVVGELKQRGLWRAGEGQSKIHSKIVELADGYLYFASMDEQGEEEDGERLSEWGSHLWRLQPGGRHWQHLFSAPEGLIAVAAGRRSVYALGYFDHVLYQYNLETRAARSVHIGSVGGHISRNFVCDQRDHVFVPRLRRTAGNIVAASLVELDENLRELGETALEHYLPSDDLLSHGITGVQPMADGSIAFVTHVGYLYRIVPTFGGAADVQPLGWFHPQGETYVASLFTYSGNGELVGVSPGPPCEWLVFDLDTHTSTAAPMPVADTLQGGLLYGSDTRDELGRLYLVGARTLSGGDELAPIALVLTPPR
jgi:hypothetical protein